MIALEKEIEKIIYSGDEPEMIVKRVVDFIKSLLTSVMSDVEAWIDDWLNLFPLGVKSGGKLVRSDKKGCLKKMAKFVLENPYYRETIMLATKEYVKSFNEEYKYMKCATYFISKEDQGSELAAWCEKVTKQGESKPVVTKVADPFFV
jgi:hypothetical protein